MRTAVRSRFTALLPATASSAGPLHTAKEADRVLERTNWVLNVAISPAKTCWKLWQDSSPAYRRTGSARHRAIVAPRLIKEVSPVKPGMFISHLLSVS